MTDLQKKSGPFAVPVPPGFPIKQAHLTICAAASRLDLLKKSTDANWLQAVIRDRDVQATVRLAAQRRLRAITKTVRA